jgi:hypothetical protein
VLSVKCKTKEMKSSPGETIVALQLLSVFEGLQDSFEREQD